MRKFIPLLFLCVLLINCESSEDKLKNDLMTFFENFKNKNFEGIKTQIVHFENLHQLGLDSDQQKELELMFNINEVNKRTYFTKFFNSNGDQSKLATLKLDFAIFEDYKSEVFTDSKSFGIVFSSFENEEEGCGILEGLLLTINENNYFIIEQLKGKEGVH